MKYLLLTTAAVLLSSCLATDHDIFIDLPDIPPSDGDSAADRTRACEVLFAVDDKLWEKRGKNMSHLAETAHFMVNRLNDIFVSQVFIDDYDDLYFRLARIQVVFGLCDVGYGSENCTQQRGQFLENFDSPRDFTDFCLAYVFTYRDFHNGTAGLASVGTVCRGYRNSGFVTFENYQTERGMNETSVTFAHEVGHNFGAHHDEEYIEEQPECDGPFIMRGGASEETPQFSTCSLKAMKEKLDELKADEKTFNKCFKAVDHPGQQEPDVALCGNNIVEAGEECDCGFDEQTCWDPCCFPAYVTLSDKQADPKRISCTKHELTRCVEPPSLVYGIYVPLAMICIAILLVGLILNYDWRNKKRCFTHITQGNVKIIRPGQPRTQT